MIHPVYCYIYIYWKRYTSLEFCYTALARFGLFHSAFRPFLSCILLARSLCRYLFSPFHSLLSVVSFIYLPPPFFLLVRVFVCACDKPPKLTKPNELKIKIKTCIVHTMYHWTLVHIISATVNAVL